MLVEVTISVLSFHRWYAPYVELFRCSLFLIIDLVLSSKNMDTGGNSWSGVGRGGEGGGRSGKGTHVKGKGMLVAKLQLTLRL